jgi:hypothetical protein
VATLKPVRSQLGELESEQPRAGGQIATIASRESDHATRHDPGDSSPLNSVVGACQSGRMLLGGCDRPAQRICARVGLLLYGSRALAGSVDVS